VFLAAFLVMQTLAIKTLGQLSARDQQRLRETIATVSVTPDRPNLVCGESAIFRTDRRDFQSCQDCACDYDGRMRDAAILLIHLLTTVAGLLRPGGARSLVAESLLLKQQLLILNRGRERAPNLKLADRLIAALCCGWIRSTRLRRVAIVLKPATLLAFHRAFVKRKYRLLFSPKRRGIPGPKGPSAEVVAAILAMKRRNPRFGCRRIAQQIS
jgi:hypothetical protein